MTTESDGEIFALRVDSSTGNLYSVQLNHEMKSPTSIVQTDPSNFIAEQWVNITKASGMQSDSMEFFFNSTAHEYFVTVSYDSDYLVAYLCYANKTDAFYGIQEVQEKRACRLIRLNPNTGTLDILSPDFNDFLASTGTCYGGYYFTMIVKSLHKRNILTFDLINKGRIIANNTADAYLDSVAFVPT
ncbi:hypothetical protein I4U23_027422 [Adineta vaga]|nr:hypothetical protein I4U23_027422 [Adineta vaga]